MAGLVSRVTNTMCGITFEPAGQVKPAPQMLWRVATLPVAGARPIRVTLSSDQDGCTSLGAALFSCPREGVDLTMVDDALCELLNMAAGQIKACLKLDQALGLPAIITADLLPPASRAAMGTGVVLRARGEVGLFIWITEGLG